MKKATLIVFLALSSMLIGCKSFEMGREMYRNVPMEVKDYDIVGTVRIEGKTNKKEVTYDGLLKEARSLYGEKVDVVGIKIDKMFKTGKPYFIINAYAIKYK